LLVAFSGVTGIKWVGSFVRIVVVPYVVPSYTKLARQLGEQFENFTHNLRRGIGESEPKRFWGGPA
jgi:hypothetical protein